MTDPRECWDCGGTEFELVGADSDLKAVCVVCETEHDPANTYIPDENGREHYEVSHVICGACLLRHEGGECPKCGSETRWSEV